MPAKSVAQRRLFALAEHHPEKLNPENKSLGNLPHQTLHDFAATGEKSLPEHKADGHMATNTTWMQRARTLATGKPVDWGEKPHLADGKGPDKWAHEAFKNAGKSGHSLHATLHVQEDKPIPKYRVRAAAKSSNPKERHQAQAALNMNQRYYN